MEKEIKLNSFSVVIPTMGRYLVKRAIQSIQNQIYDGDIEIVVVNDARDMNNRKEFGEMIDNIAEKDDRIKIIHHERNMQRVVATNDGMKNSTKDWLCFLDDDDEYCRTYLYSMDRVINENPDYSIFYFGSVMHKANITRVRECPDIKEEGPDGEAMERNIGGRVGMGSFIFKRELIDDVGYLPIGKDLTPYSFSDAMKQLRPELMEIYGPMYMDGGRELGNPWGQDFALLYLLTRKYKAKGLPLMPYIQYIRRGGFDFQDNNLNV